MASVALVYQPVVSGALELAEKCSVLAKRRGWDAALIPSRDLDVMLPRPDCALAVTFGGDGTILRVARWAAGTDVRIVGVQMGRLGFLAELQPHEVPLGLEAYLAGDYWDDRRAMLATEVIEGAGSASAPEAGLGPREGSFLALNDIVVGRGAVIRTVSVEICMSERSLHEFRCDGVIVASATGSTAYSFACGGPVLPPDSQDLVITPISPHLSTLKSFVVPGDSPIRLRVSSTEVAVVTVDGQEDQALGEVGIVEVRVAPETTVFARRGTQADLYRRILTKLG